MRNVTLLGEFKITYNLLGDSPLPVPERFEREMELVLQKDLDKNPTETNAKVEVTVREINMEEYKEPIISSTFFSSKHINGKKVYNLSEVPTDDLLREVNRRTNR